MIQLITVIVFTLFHLVTGYGVLRLLNIRLRPMMSGSLSVMIGVFIASTIPFLLQLCFIPLTSLSIFGTWFLMALLLNIKTLRHFKEIKWKGSFKVNIKLYEWPFILLLAYMLLITIWRCYYLPPTPRDLLSGPETIAEYAVKEHSFINSVFSVNLESTNNQFKSPFLHCLQLIYKLVGFPFGSIWLSMIVMSFYIFMYKALNQLIHPIFTGLLLLLLITTPEAYGYTFMVLYDYSCMVYFFLGFYFLISFFKEKSNNLLFLSALMFSISVYIRSETFAMVLMVVPTIAIYYYKHKLGFKKFALMTFAFLLLSFLAYWIPVELYNNVYLPQDYKIDDLTNKNLFDFQPLWDRISEVNDKLIFGEFSYRLYGYTLNAFGILLVAELLIKRKLKWEAATWVYGVFVVYFGLILLGFVFPLLDIMNSTKRGLFRFLPLIIFYLANNQLLQFASEKINDWENGVKVKTVTVINKSNKVKKKYK